MMSLRCKLGIHKYTSWREVDGRGYVWIYPRTSTKITYNLVSRACERCGQEQRTAGNELLKLERY